MALFQKKPQISSSAPLYTLGSHTTILVVGLGNPGKKFVNTRHNIGFETLDMFATSNDFPVWTRKKDLVVDMTANSMGQSRVILCKPQTFMNLSGQAVQAVQQFYRVSNQNILVVYDELAVPYGQIRTRIGGSDAGHNGVKSLIQHIGADFNRVRLGIGSAQTSTFDASKFVLKKFNKGEQESLPLIVQEAGAIITEFIFGGELPHDTRTVT